MILRTIISNSITARLFKKIWVGCRFLNNRIEEIYLNSYTRKMLKRLMSNIKVYFNHSYLAKLTEIKEERSRILDNSLFGSLILNSFKKLKIKFKFYLKKSFIYSLIEGLTDKFKTSFLEFAGLIIISAILTNLFFTNFLYREIGLLGWITRFVLLLIGTAALFCSVSWENFKKTSFVLKYINNYCKIKKINLK